MVKFFLIEKSTKEIIGTLMATILVNDVQHYVVKNKSGEFVEIPVDVKKYEAERVEIVD